VGYPTPQVLGASSSIVKRGLNYRPVRLIAQTSSKLDWYIVNVQVWERDWEREGESIFENCL